MKSVGRTSAGVRGFLARHRLPTLNIAGILEHEPRLEVFVDCEAEPRGLLVKGPWFWYVHTEDGAFLEEVVQEVQRRDGFYQFSGVWRPVAERLRSRFPAVWHAPCDLYVLPEGGQVPPRAGSQAVSVRLEDAEIIDEHYVYRHSGSLEKIRTCILERPSSAIYLDGRIVCWLLVHEDESLGIMYTLEEHRRKGYALDVSLDLVAKQLQAGKTPFLQIRDDNGMSPGLARKCGFVQRGNCDWFGLVAGTPPELVEGGRLFWGRLGLQSPEPACLHRFLGILPHRPLAAESLEEAEWLAFASLHFERETLTRSLAGQPGSWRFLGLREEGRLLAAAALLVDDDDGCELAWVTHREEAFLQAILQQAKGLGMAVVFTHPAPEDRPLFERSGFRGPSGA